ncbi:MAG: hypothetical protein P8O70_16645, partial [SAR324 cluster bacterium]|nr:hypothetical protein [SAR324 cluster bacterium]
ESVFRVTRSYPKLFPHIVKPSVGVHTGLTDNKALCQVYPAAQQSIANKAQQAMSCLLELKSNQNAKGS